MPTFDDLLTTDNLNEARIKINESFSKLEQTPTTGVTITNVSLLPALPDPDFPVDQIVYLTTDGKLYKNVANVWVAVVNTSDLEGQITADKIADGSIGGSKFATSISAPIVVATLPTLPDPEYPPYSLVVWSNDGKLYRNVSDTWTAAVPTSDLTGTITETQITDGAISTPKIAAGAVTANEIEANTITAGQIAAGAIGADEIAAKSVQAQHLVVADYTNVAPNPDFADGGTHWNFFAGATVETVADAPYSPSVSIPENSSSQPGFITTDKIPVDEGTEWYAGAWVKRLNNPANLVCIMYFYDKNDAYISAEVLFSLNSGDYVDNEWNRVSAISDPFPTGTVSVRLQYSVSGTGPTPTNEWVVSHPVMRKAAGGELIVDGAITANKILAGEINASHLAVDSVTAGAIQAGSIGASEIAASSIRSKHLVIADYSNVAPNPLFEDNGANWTMEEGVVTTFADAPYDTGVQLNEVEGWHAGFSASERIPVTEGTEWWFGAWVRRFNGPARLGGIFHYFDKDGNFISDWIVWDAHAIDYVSGEWNLVYGISTPVPAGAVDMTVQIRIIGAGPDPTNQWDVVHPVLRKAAGGELIVEGSITADKISAGAITTDKLTTGEINLTNSGRDGYISVRDGGNALKARFGNISGLSGVPSGTQYGMWGELGTGVYIKGAPRVLVIAEAGPLTQALSSPNLAVGDTTDVFMYPTFSGPWPYTVPEGKKVVYLAAPTTMRPQDANDITNPGKLVTTEFNTGFRVNGAILRSGTSSPAGTTINSVDGRFYAVVRAFEASTAAEMQYGAMVLIVEVDA